MQFSILNGRLAFRIILLSTLERLLAYIIFFRDYLMSDSRCPRANLLRVQIR